MSDAIRLMPANRSRAAWKRTRALSHSHGTSAYSAATRSSSSRIALMRADGFTPCLSFAIVRHNSSVNDSPKGFELV